MTPSKKPSAKLPHASIERLHDHAPTDWEMRKGDSAYPFDIVVLTQTPVESEFDLLFDHGAEPAATFHGNSRIYRLKDNRFAVMSVSTGTLNSPPDHIEFWNWWGRTHQPSFSDLTTAREIGHKIEQLEFLRQSAHPAIQ
jgi:hypothetical protein